jgi:hypothetical protein
MHAVHACRIAEYQDSRSRKLEEVRNRRQFAELEECTFAPALRPPGAPRARASSASRSRPVVVRGLDGFMGRQERARQLAAEAAARRCKVFHEAPRAARAKFTIAQPFNISDNHPVRATPSR